MERFNNGIFFEKGEISKIHKRPYWFEFIVYSIVLIFATIISFTLFHDSIIAWLIVGLILLANINNLVSYFEINIGHNNQRLELLNKNITGTKRKSYLLNQLNFQFKKAFEISYNSGWAQEKFHFIILNNEEIIETSIETTNKKSCERLILILEQLTRKSISINENTKN